MGAILALAIACVTALAHAATPSVSAGGSHSVALGTDGAVRTWGNDATGALGVGRSLVSSSPIQVAGASGITAIASGASHVIALKNDGSVLAWGENSNGQLGDGTRTNRSTPVAVSGLTGVAAISARGAHSLALKIDGSVWAWGANGSGQLGDGTYEDRLVPVLLIGVDDVAELSAGGQFTLARKRDGTVWAWGANESGQLGDGKTTALYTGRATPELVRGIIGVVQISAGGQHSLARKDDGSVWAWGSNSGGALGDGTTTDRSLPVPVMGLGGAIYIAAGFGHSIAIRNDLTAWGWGSNGYSELGDDTYVDRLLPVPLGGLNGTTTISTGFLHSFAVIAGGTLVAWGQNESGQLGDGTTQQRGTPSPMTAISGVLAVAVGDQHTVALKADRTVWTWGDNASGQLGNGTLVFRSTPVATGLSSIEKIAAGGAHTVALKTDGTVLTWGDNRAGQLGDGTSRNRSTPAAVNGLGAASTVLDIAAGGLHTLARKSDGSVVSWGYNYSNQLGDRSSADTSLPATVSAISGVTRIAAGADHSVALRSDGTVWAWGRNNSGQLGDGTRTDGYAGRSTPAAVPGLTGVREIAAGSAHTVALKIDGSVWAWGSNGGGRLGDGTTIDRSTPVQVSGLSDVIAIAAGDVHTLALKRDGSVWAWGSNYSYQLGDGTSADRSIPVQVPGLTGIIAISAASHSLALKDDGSVSAWGRNDSGPLGDGTLVDRGTPVAVLRENGAGSIQGNDWFLDLDPGVATTIPADKIPVFLVVASGTDSSVTANLRYRAQDVGQPGGVYVFALAPASIVKDAQVQKDALVVMNARQKEQARDTPLPCVLAQLNASGQLQGVASASNLQSFVSVVLGSQSQSVTILNGVATAQASGATFFVGYGASATTMLNNGTNRSVVSVPGAASCQPQRPQTGWWWNPAEPGRGYSMEVHGNNLFFASYLYDVSGRATWYVAAGPTWLDGSLFNGRLLSVAHGQTLTGDYHAPDPAADNGAITLAFNDASHGAMIWPGGSVPIERFSFGTNGLNTTPLANQPENGWWWNADQSGRGFFIEWQGGSAFVAGYMYDATGNPIWYVSQLSPPNPQSLQGNWLQFGNGQTLTGAYKLNSLVNGNVGSLGIQFQNSTNATMTLPNNQTLPLTRFRF